MLRFAGLILGYIRVSERRNQGSSSPLRGLAAAGNAGSAGFITAGLILLAVFAGRWLDSLFGTEPWLVIVLVLASIPLSLVLMVRSVLSAARAAQSTNRLSSNPSDGYEEDISLE